MNTTTLNRPFVSTAKRRIAVLDNQKRCGEGKRLFDLVKSFGTAVLMSASALLCLVMLPFAALYLLVHTCEFAVGSIRARGRAHRKFDSFGPLRQYGL